MVNLDVHISSGMFGMILVEPKEGWPEVDHELYFGQHGLYTTGAAGEEGHHDFGMEAMAAGEPTYVLTNGEKYAITPDVHGSSTIEVGDTARVLFAVGGPGPDSSFHPIGSVWDEVYPQGATQRDPHVNVQTTPIKPGATVVATLHAEVPGRIKLVDHTLSRVARKDNMVVIMRERGQPRRFRPRTVGVGRPDVSVYSVRVRTFSLIDDSSSGNRHRR